MFSMDLAPGPSPSNQSCSSLMKTMSPGSFATTHCSERFSIIFAFSAYLFLATMILTLGDCATELLMHGAYKSSTNCLQYTLYLSAHVFGGTWQYLRFYLACSLPVKTTWDHDVNSAEQFLAPIQTDQDPDIQWFNKVADLHEGFKAIGITGFNLSFFSLANDWVLERAIELEYKFSDGDNTPLETFGEWLLRLGMFGALCFILASVVNIFLMVYLCKMATRLYTVHREDMDAAPSNGNRSLESNVASEDCCNPALLCCYLVLILCFVLPGILLPWYILFWILYADPKDTGGFSGAASVALGGVFMSFFPLVMSIFLVLRALVVVFVVQKLWHIYAPVNHADLIHMYKL